MGRLTISGRVSPDRIDGVVKREIAGREGSDTRRLISIDKRKILIINFPKSSRHSEFYCWKVMDSKRCHLVLSPE